MKLRLTQSLLFLLLAAVFSSCQRAQETADCSVWVSIGPQQFLAERLVGDLASVQVLLRPGQSPEVYSPSAAELADVSRADLYFGIGLPLEHSILSRIATAKAGVRFIQTGHVLSDAHDHSHGHDHSHDEEDPHIWMDPTEMIRMVEIMRNTLAEALPQSTDVISRNADSLVEDLSALDVEIGQIMLRYKGRGFFINHPSLGYFAERYGLEQFSIELAGTSPSARRIADLVQLAKDEGVRAVLTQPEFGRSSATVLARELGLEVIQVDPLARNYLENMRAIAASIQEGFADE